MKKTLARSALVIASLIVTTAALELSLRVFFHFHTDYDIEMWRYATHLKIQTPDLRSHIHRRSTDAKLMNEDVRINSLGLREREIPLEKPHGIFRILAIGDSFTMGWGVNAENTFTRVAEKSLNVVPSSNPVQIINAGVGNYNTVQELTAYEMDYKRYSPDLVIFFFYINDAEPTQKNSGNFFETHSYLAALVKIEVNRLYERRLSFDSYYNSLYEGESWENYKAVVAQAAHIAKSSSAAAAGAPRFAVVILPDLRNLEHYPFTMAQAKVAAEFKRVGIPVVDATPAFRGISSPSMWVAPDDPHPNAAAHKIIAKVVTDYILSHRRTFFDQRPERILRVSSGQ